MLAGIPVTDDDTEALVELLRAGEFPDIAGNHERLLASGVDVFALTIIDRESILWALDEAADGRARRLREVLLREHDWRVKEGFV